MDGLLCLSDFQTLRISFVELLLLLKITAVEVYSSDIIFYVCVFWGGGTPGRKLLILEIWGGVAIIPFGDPAGPASDPQHHLILPPLSNPMNEFLRQRQCSP